MSGRTSLLLVIGALGSVVGFVRGSIFLSCAGLSAALLSKEESVAVPLIWLAAYLTGLAPNWTRKRLAVVGSAGVSLVAAYLIARSAFGAVSPATAPPYYRFTFDPAVVARNLLEYSDRACTFGALTLLLGWVILRPSRLSVPRGIVTFGVAWIVAGYAITIWLPVRSSLYACFPSVGAALIAAALAEAMWRSSGEAARRYALAAVVGIPLLCAPIYVARNHRWTDLADLSAAALADVASHIGHVPADGWLVLVDDRARRADLESAFGTLIGDAVFLQTGREVPVWVEPPLTYATLAGLHPPCNTCPTFQLALREGRLVPVQ
jgi:hypothetical protein